MKKILLSLLTIGAVGALAFGASQAFFSDVETSTGNTFTAGSLDLKVDNESWYFTNGIPVKRDDLSWQLDNLTGRLFFNFSDIKPGDWGEDTVSLHVFDNDAWGCADLYVTKNDDMSSTEPELEDGDAVEVPADIMDGELAQKLQFFFWVDDRDNVYEVDELPLIGGTAYEAIGGLHYALADSQENNVGGGTKQPLVGSTDYYIGKIWCYGALQVTPVPQDVSGPDVRHFGIICDGSLLDNESQSDNVMAEISFYAEQARNNAGFVCGINYTPSGMQILNLENKDTGWNVISDSTYGTMVYSASPTFYGTVVAQGLVPNAKYQITLNGPGDCNTTDALLASAGSNLFESGYWNYVGNNLQSTCAGDYGEGVYNMNLINDHYTVMTDSLGKFNYAFNLTLPSGSYSGVKVLVKKMLDDHISPWVDSSTVHTTNLFETGPISFTVD